MRRIGRLGQRRRGRARVGQVVAMESTPSDGAAREGAHWPALPLQLVYRSMADNAARAGDQRHAVCRFRHVPILYPRG